MYMQFLFKLIIQIVHFLKIDYYDNQNFIF